MDEYVTFDAATVWAYNLGFYEEAEELLRLRLREQPGALGACFSLLYTCERVTSTALRKSDVELG